MNKEGSAFGLKTIHLIFWTQLLSEFTQLCLLAAHCVYSDKWDYQGVFVFYNFAASILVIISKPLPGQDTF